jgi:hypothetical protein
MQHPCLPGEGSAAGLRSTVGCPPAWGGQLRRFGGQGRPKGRSAMRDGLRLQPKAREPSTRVLVTNDAAAANLREPQTAGLHFLVNDSPTETGRFLELGDGIGELREVLIGAHGGQSVPIGAIGKLEADHRRWRNLQKLPPSLLTFCSPGCPRSHAFSSLLPLPDARGRGRPE